MTKLTVPPRWVKAAQAANRMALSGTTALPRPEHWEFDVPSEHDETVRYHVTVLDPYEFDCRCTCPSGAQFDRSGVPCKHMALAIDAVLTAARKRADALDPEAVVALVSGAFEPKTGDC
jgi:hypothetical protein